ncbi:O-antigen ligase family protein [Flavobacteriaceae bacterium]|nr:O-antigen ligase family protein [Flavobacteriaceae bacterium]
MSATQFRTTQLPNYIILILYIITGSLGNLGAIDILAPQWIYLGAVNILACLYLLFFNTESAQFGLSKLYKSIFIYVYLFYFIWSGLSYFYAINPTETLINLPRLGNTFFAIFFCFILLHGLENKIVFISRVFIGFLAFELFAFYNDLFTQLENNTFNSMNLKGVAGNKNITAASIAFKVPFVLYSIVTVRKGLLKLILSFLLFTAIFAISILYARSAILSSFIVFLIFLVYSVFTLLSDRSQLKYNLKNLLLTITPYLLAVFINITFTNSQNKGNIGSQLGNIEFTEQSSNGRFKYWSDAFEHIQDHPIIGAGLGNWKIASISYGKEHVKGYTVPYHAHNDFIHVFAEVGILGGVAYLSLFGLLTFFLFRLLYVQRKEDGNTDFSLFLLVLPFIIYGIDAGLNFPVARPLMQSALALYMGLLLSIYLNRFTSKEAKPVSPLYTKFILGLSLLLLIPGIIIHVLSFQSLTQQGRLLYEFNNAKYNLTLAELDEIEDDFPNLTETAMPIKAMKARYFYLNNQKEKAHQYALLGAKDNPQIFFGESLKAQFFASEQQIDSAYYYSKLAFENLPNNMPHYNLYMNSLVARKDVVEMNKSFETVRALAGDTPLIWTIYLRSLANVTGLGDTMTMSKAAEAFKLFPQDDTIFSLYRILTYGQQRVVQAEQLYKQGIESYNAKDFSTAFDLFNQAFDLDPLEYTYALNSGLALYEDKQYPEAVGYLDRVQNSQKVNLKEKALRYKGLALYKAGSTPEACATFLKLKNTYPKRMYQQEFNKYCTN